MIEVCGEAPVPPTLPEIKITSAFGLGHPGGNGADPRSGDQFDADLGLGVDLLEVIDQLRQILDRNRCRGAAVAKSA